MRDLEKVVYLHRKGTTNDVFYVGIGYEKRAYSKNNRNKWWHNVVNKHDYNVEIVERSYSWDECAESEKAMIELIGRKDLGLGELVNLTNGGEGSFGRVHSSETKRKISKANRGNVINTKKVIEETSGLIFNSVQECASHYGITQPTMTALTRGEVIKRGKCKNKMFNYV